VGGAAGAVWVGGAAPCGGDLAVGASRPVRVRGGRCVGVDGHGVQVRGVRHRGGQVQASRAGQRPVRSPQRRVHGVRGVVQAQVQGGAHPDHDISDPAGLQDSGDLRDLARDTSQARSPSHCPTAPGWRRGRAPPEPL